MTCSCATVGLLKGEAVIRITESDHSRRPTSTSTAMVIPADIPPSQNANRLSMGRGREINSAVIPIRTGSSATTTDSARIALHTADTCSR